MENLLVGSYSEYGICKLSFDNGILTKVFSDNTFKDCSYLYKYNDNIFNVVEGSDFDNSFISSRNLDLSVINSINNFGISPCYICLDKNRNLLYIANYMSGSFCVFSLNTNGSLNKLIFSKTFTTHSHIHCVKLSCYENFLFITDLGDNKLFAYRIIFDGEHFDLELVSEYNFPEDTQPRHFVIKDNDIFLVTENSCELYHLTFSDNTCIKLLEKISLLPDNIPNSPDYTGCAIKFNKDKSLLYISVRGLDNVCVFSFTQALKLKQTISCYGSCPRDLLVLDRYLLCANQMSNSISIFDINKNTGELMLNNIFNIEHPACIIAL